jgi:hypothetical protein
MWRFRVPVFLLLAGACSDNTGTGNSPDVPTGLVSTSLNGAIALAWSDNSFAADPSNFQHYSIFSTSYDLDTGVCGSWRLEGTTVAPEFIVGALSNGAPRCFRVSAVSVDGVESAPSQIAYDTPRPDSRNVVLYPFQVDPDSSGFRFWDDDGDGVVESGELGRVRPGDAAGVDFFIDRISGELFFTPVRTGTGVELYSDVPVEDLTSITVAPCPSGPTPGSCAPYLTSPILASPGFGYVFETVGDDGLRRFGAIRVTHVGTTFLIMDWSFQTDFDNPELLVQGIRR